MKSHTVHLTMRSLPASPEGTPGTGHRLRAERDSFPRSERVGAGGAKSSEARQAPTPRVRRDASASPLVPGGDPGECAASTPQFNDDEPGLHRDYKKWLEWLAPYDPSPARYDHNKTGEDNGDAHHKRQIMGREVVVAVTDGALDFGPWEQIFYGEFDGRRPKRVLVKVIGE